MATPRKATSRRAKSSTKSGTAAAARRAGPRASKSGTARGRREDQLAPVVSLLDRLERLVGGLGNNKVAELLDVSQSQPSRWRRSQEGIDPENQRRVLDLDYVMSRLLQLYPPEQARLWLRSHNAHLGARPVDVLRQRGVAPVIQAIDAEAEGAYA
jgi:hypothetical protein